ncbi:hypothetical protein F0562_022335 [Nyssa sinensis]|uniref:Uncharacterized protein n=1 Tax=Nyssa sinensis TaxID=561372 RepID=A0A5J5BME1_9ASTE|nr:hypothetical protein F0562_022335 [Nyssa sinensis]
MRTMTYLEAARIGEWPSAALEVEHAPIGAWEDIKVNLDSCEERLLYVSRCLLGRLRSSPLPVPERERVQRWVDKHRRVVTSVSATGLCWNSQFGIQRLPIETRVSSSNCEFWISASLKRNEPITRYFNP